MSFARIPLIALLCLFCPLEAAAGEVRGRVVDGSGAPVTRAKLYAHSALGTLAAEAATDDSGAFSLGELRRGSYLLRVVAGGFEALELSFDAGRDSSLPSPIELSPARVYSAITVTATRGAVEDIHSTPRVVSVKNREEFRRRPLVTLGNALEDTPGAHVQQSTYGQVSPFLRGLTGYHVVNLIDGVRFNNSTFRSGPNQYLAFVEPSQAQRIEVLLGPSGAQYGSDSLGGSINVVTVSPRYGAGSSVETHGELNAFTASADASGGADARLSIGTSRVSWLVGATGRRHNDLRAGGGADSRNVFARYFGLSADQRQRLTGNRQQDTGFTQRGAHTKLSTRIADDQSFSMWYQHSTLTGVRGYKDLLGGRGRMQASFDPQALHFFYARYEKLGLGRLDSLSGVFSVNSQMDGAITQKLRATDPITRDDNRVDALGYSVQATTHAGSRFALVFGGDIYDEQIHSVRFRELPLTGVTRQQRALYPDGSRYRTFGSFAQSTTEVIPGKLRLGLGGRFTGVWYKTSADPRFGVVESSQSFRDVTFNGSLSWRVSRRAGLHALVSRGFRAPNLNDLGAIGLNDLGYEIPAAEAIPAGALLTTSAGEGALSKGEPVRALGPETLLNYEAGLTVAADRFYARVQVFDAELEDPIVRRTLLFPNAALPATLGGLPVTPLAPTPEQLAQGVAAVATESDPRAVKAFVNDGCSRYYGLEALLRYAVSARWSLEGNYSFLAGRELNPNRPVRRLPPQRGYAGVRYTPSGRRPWLAIGASVSGAQRRLSGGDISDERIGAARSRRDIAAFFGGTRAGAHLDDAGERFLPTGETLRQMQDRVLPLGTLINGVRVLDDNTRVPLYLRTGGWFALDLRGGIPLGERLSLNFAVMNVFDANYRTHGSGVDAPGISAYVGARYSF